MEKYKRQEVSPVEEENERDETYEASNPQIDSNRTSRNYHLVTPPPTYLEFINARIATLTLKRKLRSDAVYMNSFVLTSDKDFFMGLPLAAEKEFFTDCVKFFADKYGAENIISAVVHKDETTPHLHLNLVPITNGKLCSKDLYDRKKLSELQTSFYEKVGKKWGLERGKFKSGAKHITAAEYKAQKIIEEAEGQAEKIKAESEPYQEALERAQNRNFAWTPIGLKKQVIAATAETIKTKKENEDLTRRLDASMSETLHYAKKADTAEENAARGKRAIELLAKLQRENPEAYEKLIHPTPKPKSNTNFKF
ncbi:MAG: plasmid recombination protein [Clostridia bacterium]|nr:plasmid recombination protein [Clostridia bacterium]